jgi:hypothetical protein
VEEFGFAVAALVVEDDLTVVRKACGEDVILQKVGVGEARAAVGDDDGCCAAAGAVDLVGEIDIGGVDDSRRWFL